MDTIQKKILIAIMLKMNDVRCNKGIPPNDEFIMVNYEYLNIYAEKGFVPDLNFEKDYNLAIASLRAVSQDKGGRFKVEMSFKEGGFFICITDKKSVWYKKRKWQGGIIDTLSEFASWYLEKFKEE